MAHFASPRVHFYMDYELGGDTHRAVHALRKLAKKHKDAA